MSILTNKQKTEEYNQLAYQCVSNEVNNACIIDCLSCPLNISHFIDDKKDAVLIKMAAMSKITKGAKANNYEWDYLIWICYDTKFNVTEARGFKVDLYKELFDQKKRLSPDDMRMGMDMLEISADKV